jgi:NADH-quinone oxidoreductase subunit J
MAQILFFYFATIILASAALVVILRNPVYSALSIFIMFLHVAGIFVLLNAEFIAAIQMLVYAGAILVLYLFVVMLLNLRREERYHRQYVLGGLLGVVILTELLLVMFQSTFSPPTGPYTPAVLQAVGNTEAVGKALFTTYLLPFEVASLVLLAAMIGSIVLAKRVVQP